MSTYNNISSWLAAMPRQLSADEAQKAKQQLEELANIVDARSSFPPSPCNADVDDLSENMTFLTHGANEPSVDEHRRLYIGHLSRATVEADIRFFLRDFDIECVLTPSSRNDKPFSFAFVDLYSANEALRAVKLLSGKTIRGKRVVVDIARPSSTAPPSSSFDDFRERADSPTVMHHRRDMGTTDTEPNINHVFHEAKMNIINRMKTFNDYALDPQMDDIQKAELMTLDRRVSKIGPGRYSISINNHKTSMLKGTDTQGNSETRKDEQLGNLQQEHSSHVISSTIGQGHADYPTKSSAMVLFQKHTPKSSSSSSRSSGSTVKISSSDRSSEKTISTNKTTTNKEEELRKQLEQMKAQIEKLTMEKEMQNPLGKQKAVVATKDGVKTHCTFFLRTGYCDFMQQGCKYSHELPPGGIEELRRQAGLPPIGLGQTPLKFANNDISTLPLGRGGQKHGMRHAKLDFSQPTQDLPDYHPARGSVHQHTTNENAIALTTTRYTRPYNRNGGPQVFAPNTRLGRKTAGKNTEPRQLLSLTPSASASQSGGDVQDKFVMSDVVNQLTPDLLTFSSIKG